MGERSTGTEEGKCLLERTGVNLQPLVCPREERRKNGKGMEHTERKEDRRRDHGMKIER